MESIVRLIVAAFELVEAEGRMLKEQLVRISIAMALGIIIALLALAGLGFLMYSLFLYLVSTPLSTAGAAAVFGLISLLLAAAGGLAIRALLSSRGK